MMGDVNDDARKDRQASKKQRNKELVRLQAELVKLQETVRSQGLRVVVLFEGRVMRELARAEADEEAIMHAATGMVEEAAA